MIILLYLIAAVALVAFLLRIRAGNRVLGELIAKAHADERARDGQPVIFPDPAVLLAQAGAAPECGCRFWNPEADRPEWLPCGDHLEALIRDVKSA